jgi:hypothetical protein
LEIEDIKNPNTLSCFAKKSEMPMKIKSDHPDLEPWSALVLLAFHNGCQTVAQVTEFFLARFPKLIWCRRMIAANLELCQAANILPKLRNVGTTAGAHPCTLRRSSI